MTIRRHVALAVAPLIWLGMVTGTQAAVSVTSHDDDARQCFAAASQEGPAQFGLATCSTALQSDDLDLVDRAATFVNRGILKERMSDLQGALSDYDAGIALRPNLADAYVDRGGLMIKLKRYTEAFADMSKGIELGPQFPQIAYYDRGLLREHTGDFAGACSDYQQALVFQPRFDLANQRVNLCRFYKRAKPS